MSRIPRILLLVLAALSPSQAAIIQTYTSSTLFSTAFTQMGSTITFEAIQTVTGAKDFSTPAGLTTSAGTAGNVNFTQTGDAAGPNDYSLAVYRQPSGWTFWNTGAVLVLASPNISYTTITLPTAATAIGFNVMTGYNYGGTFTVVLGDGSSTTCGTLNNPNAAYCGVTSSVAFTTVTLTTAGGRGIIDNVAFGTADVADTPELTTLMMIGFGLLVIRYSGQKLGRVA